MATSSDRVFLVRLSGKYFFISRIPNDRRMHGTLFMSFGLRMSYLVAAEVALRIRAAGWSDALVCDLHGNPISLENIPVEEFAPSDPDDAELDAAWDSNFKSLDAEVQDAPQVA